MAAYAAGVTRRDNQAWRRVMWGAWHGAAFSRSKKVPRLQGILNRMRPPRRAARSPEQLLAEFEAFSKALGGAGLKRRPRLKAAYRMEET
jgi:hypothetical protein